MLPEAHIKRMLHKLKRLEDTLVPYLFHIEEELPAEACQTAKQYYAVPEDLVYAPVQKGWPWGGPKQYLWIRTRYTVPERLDGRDLFLMPRLGGYEALLFVDGAPSGTFNTKIVYTGHGNHYCDLVRKNAKAGETIDLAVEYYAGHKYQGCDPFDTSDLDLHYTYDGLYLCTKNDALLEYWFDLKTVGQLAESLPENSFFRARAINALARVHDTVLYDPDSVAKDLFFERLFASHAYLKEILAETNGPAAPFIGLIGHSHMDTAWLWPLEETLKKCARTYSNELSLMEQYPEYRFIQSSAFHSDMLRRYYPTLFERIREKVKEGRYEPNGGVWVECDCNITGGESMVRQFLWGQRFTRKYFDYTADSFWLPDTFGYSAAIPQIMKGCGTKYFLTTKISWNDTNEFPYDTFYWEGLDGTRVLTHFNQSHTWPDAETLIQQAASIRQKGVTDCKLISYGFGDGGGGPMFEMIEMARRVRDLNEVPRSETMTVSRFMQDLEEHISDPNVYRGELYLELHRGTLTNQHEIKYNNRKAEVLLHDLEWLTAAKAMAENKPADISRSNELLGTLLVNQFHDILPGTCIPEAHQRCKTDMRNLLTSAKTAIQDLLYTEDASAPSVWNPLSFPRKDTLFIPQDILPEGACPGQAYTNLYGHPYRILGGLSIPAYSGMALPVSTEAQPSPFQYDGNHLSTPFYEISFDDDGFMTSCYDSKAGRELAAGPLPLGAFVMAEDVPSSWDNWDLDPDIQRRFAPCATCISSMVISDGPWAFVIRRTYCISEKSTIDQDQIFFADSPEIRYDTLMHWQDDHRFLKARFDVDVRADHARHEIQFGHVLRPTTRNTTWEQARFEVAQHKYTDLSEPGYGIAFLNDCKYGISVDGSQVGLSLHKGGLRPDYTGDHGDHHVVYSFLPHPCGFSAEAVVRPAYQLNYHPVFAKGTLDLPQIAKIDKANIIIETIKPCEDAARALILRLYETEGTRTNALLTLSEGITTAYRANMLEEVQEPLTMIGHALPLSFHPFEIQTIKVCY
ncbi:MAG: alpha-mannosidase [Clostridiales bacterium]|nr:alpha-mannosidase [Clostridiales bacterium]